MKHKRNWLVYSLMLLSACSGCKKNKNENAEVAFKEGVANGYPIVHTNVKVFYDDAVAYQSLQVTSVYYNQDAALTANMPSYTDNGDGSITDNVTRLVWQKDMGEKMTMEEAMQKLSALNQGINKDWRIPSIKELFSLAQYSGRVFGDGVVTLFIDTAYFKQPVGNTAAGEREIDAQTWSSTNFNGRTMNNDESRFGFNFVDGRIKAYPLKNPFTQQPNKLYFRFVRGNEFYGVNKFVNNNDGTITDLATGLMWQQQDNGTGIDWKTALKYADDLALAGKTDWRLPTIKELQSIAEYSISVQQKSVAAINPVFKTSIRNEPNGNVNFPFYWSSTTLLDGPAPGNQAAYVCFGKATARMNGNIVDAHGAGAVRSDPKAGNPANYPTYFGPQGDIQYVLNFVRCVRKN